MKRFITICLLLLSCQYASAQHDLYKWQLSGYTGIANYINEENSSADYFKTNHNLLYRLDLTRHIGNSLGLSVSYSFGEVRGRDQLRTPFTTDVRMSAVRAYFYTDNGWMFHTSALISPYFFGGYGLTMLETTTGAVTEESRYVPAIPFGMGLKFRLGERWQLSLQTEAVYLTDSHLQGPALEQNDFNNAYLHTGLTLGYSFGFKKSTFKAPRFYANNVALLQTVEGQNQPRQNYLELMLKLPPKPVQLPDPQDSANVATLPEIAQRPVYSPADTLSIRRVTIDGDSSSVAPQVVAPQVVPAGPVQNQDTATAARPSVATSSAGTGTAQDTLGVPNEATTAQPDTAVQINEARPDSLALQQPVAAPAQRVQPQQTTTQPESVTAAQQAAPVRTKVITQERAPTTTRVRERVVYVPANTRPATVQNREAAAVQLREERLRLTAVNADNRRLQRSIDSLQAVPPTVDTLRTAAAVDTSLVQYLQQQATLNDSMLQRLNQYEQELTLLRAASAAPVAVPVVAVPAEVAPASNAVTVFYPINAHRVPTESLGDLNQTLKVLQENPDLHVRLTGYASQSGNAVYNLALSRKRVASLVNFLTVQGIAKERISIQYMGDEKASAKENPLDRKVEVELID